MANRFWVGGTANWDGTAGTKWATTSGGAGGAAVPTSADDVFFDGSSGAGTATIAAGNTGCKSLSCAGYTGTLAGSAALDIAGSLTWGAGMTRSYTGAINFSATSAQTITSNGKTTGSAITFNGVGGSWQLVDTFSSSAAITLTNGTFDTNAQTLQSSTFASSNSNTRTLTITNSTWTLTGNTLSWEMTTVTNLTFNSSGSLLLFRNNTATNTQFRTGGLTYGDITFGGTGSGQLTILNGGPTIRDLNITNSGAGTFLFQVNIVTRDFKFNAGYTGTWSGTSQATISGDFMLAAGMTRTSTGALIFNATAGTKTITSNGIALANAITLNGVGGTWQLADAINTTQAISLTNGSFVTNGNSVTCQTLSANNTNTKGLDITNSTWTATGLNMTVWNIGGTGTTFVSTGSTIIVDNTGSAAGQTQTFSQDGLTYNDLTFQGSGAGGFNINSNPGNATFRDFNDNTTNTPLTIVGSNTFRHFGLNNPPHTLILGFRATETVSSLSMSGSPGNLITISTNLAGSSARFVQTGNNAVCDYLSLKDCVAAGGARWFAGQHSVNNGGNNGWRFCGASNRASPGSSSSALLM